MHPVALPDDDGNQNIRLGEVDRSGKAARGDIAAVLARAVPDKSLAGKPFLMEGQL